MVEIKIECECGQHYAFEVEPVNNRMPAFISCPGCGADGTVAANQIIAQTNYPPPAAPPPPPPASSLHLATHQATAPSSTGIHRDPRSLGMVDREQAKAEAHAKISWGDKPEAVIRYLMIQGLPADEAKELVDEFVKDRLKDVRAKGIRQICIGFVMSTVPFITFFTIGFGSIAAMGVALLIGAYGFYLLVNGIIITVAPKIESGDPNED